RTVWIVDREIENDSRLAALRERGVKIIGLERVRGSIQPVAIGAALYQLGVRSLLLEGGAGLYAPWLRAGLVRRGYFFIAPKLFGGSNRLSLVQSFTEQSNLQLDNVKLTLLGEDLL